MNMMQLTHIQYQNVQQTILKWFCFKVSKDTLLVDFVVYLFDHFCDFYISLFIINHVQLKLDWTVCNISGLWKSVTSKSCVTPGSH